MKIKSILPLVLLIAASLPLYAQKGKPVSAGNPNDTKPREATERCKLTLEDLPPFHSVKYGMSYDGVAEIYPEIKTDKFFQTRYAEDQSGSFILESSEHPDRPYQADFKQLSLYFQHGKVEIIAMQYAPGKWGSITDAITGLSGDLGLVFTNWTVFYEQSAEAVCGDFAAYANSQGVAEQRQNSMSIHPKKK